MRIRATLLSIWVACGLSTAWGQEYRFSVPELMLEVYVHNNASITLDYTVTFVCSLGAHPIDIVDIGLPDRDYDIRNMSASVNNAPLFEIRRSTAIHCGVEVPLGEHAINPGESAVFRFEATMPDRVYQDTTRKDYASLWITPTWWGAQYVEGTSKIACIVYLPEEIKPEEVLHQGQEFSLKGSKPPHTVVGWINDGLRVDGPHMYKLSFPKRTMTRVVQQTAWGLFMKWWRDNPRVRLGWGVVLLTLYAIVFFRVSKGTGVTVFLFIAAIVAISWAIWPPLELLGLPALVPLWYLSEKALRQRRGHYLPAIASVEGGGIKRGLSAPEAAIILELPLGQVLTMIIFGLLRKGLVKQVQADPLQVQVAPEFAGLTHKERQAKARSMGTVIRGYEQPFLDQIEAHPGRPLQLIDFSSCMSQAIRATARRVKGFDLERTRQYYRAIVSRAWAEAKAIGDVEKRTEYTDDNLLWLLADPYAYDDFAYWHTSGYHYRPPWARTTTVGGGTSEQSAAGQTTFTDVSRSFAGWAENLAGGLASKLDPHSMGLDRGGLVDLSGVDRITIDVLESLAESRGSGGGRGCACAGCACACACAGGGR